MYTEGLQLNFGLHFLSIVFFEYRDKQKNYTGNSHYGCILHFLVSVILLLIMANTVLTHGLETLL